MFETMFELTTNSDVPQDVQDGARQRQYELQRERRENSQSLSSQIERLRKAYRQELQDIIGTENEYSYSRFRSASKQKMRDARAQISPETLLGKARIQEVRCQIMTEAHELLGTEGLGDILKLRQDYSANIQKVFPVALLQGIKPEAPTGDVVIDEKPPWVIHTPPYDGSFWSFHWDRSDEPDEPILQRHLDQAIGQIGSSINLRVDGADNDDTAIGEYFTALKLWHQMSAAGQLEGYMVLKRRSAAFHSCTATDEFGFSTATISQGVWHRMSVLAPDGSMDVREGAIGGRAEFLWGEDVYWNLTPLTPNNLYWYYFKTDRSYSAGTWLSLEAAVHHLAWFDSDDISVTLDGDFDLQLQSVRVRPS